ncbi:MAG: DNA polymerase III subunit alpha [Bacteroidales bacterium]
MILARSYYSLRYGVISVENLVKRAVACGMDHLCLTDINNTSGIIELAKYCHEHGLRPIAGIEFRNKDTWLYTGIAKSHEGLYHLNNFLSHYRLRKKDLPSRPPVLEGVIFIFPYGSVDPSELQENQFVGIRLQDINKIVGKEYPARASKLMAIHPVTFLTKEDLEMHRHLRAIDHNTLLTQLNEDWLASEKGFFYAPDQIKENYKHFPELKENARIIENLPGLNFGRDIKNKKTFTGSREEDRKLLEKLAYEGMQERYGPDDPVARERIDRELEVINRLGFGAYFLITHDIIRYSMQRGFHHVGRGSGANSVVAYCLQITDVDPIELNLYFERFINPKRSSPPDFDIDYSWKERDEVLDYIFRTYPEEHTALLGTISTFRGRSIIRELGKVYGLPKAEIDSIVEQPARHINKDTTVDKIFQLAGRLTDFPNLRSIHAGGVLISEKPVSWYTALDLPPKGYPTTQWDMYSAEDIGFEKLDILSQRGIGHIRDGVEIIRENQAVEIEIHNVDAVKNDPKARELLRSGETTGCFYIESPAMRGLLKKLRCDTYLTLVAASSIIRPGVAKSGMMKEYIRRFHNPDGFDYIHPVMKEQLKETYGVMVYQEDVLKVCHHFAGLDLADADILRRAMSGKFRSKKEFQKIEDKFFSNCRERGYPENIIKEVWRQIESFAGYSFSKAHSASYAVESFQSLYLKAYYPREFLTAVINNFGGFYHTWLYINEAQRYGARIHLPSVNYSHYLTRIIGRDIYLGFIHVKDMEQRTASLIVGERKQGGAYGDLADFIYRTGIHREQIILLIRTGALRFTGITKPELLWKAHMLTGKKKTDARSKELFRPEGHNYELPEFEQSSLEDAYDEMELLGFPVTLSRFDMLKTSFRGEVLARNLMDHVGEKKRLVGQLVNIKYVKTVKGEIMNFAAFIDLEGEFFDTVHFPGSLKAYPFRGYGVYLLLGKIVEEFGFPSVEVEKMAKLPLKPDPREA